MQWDRINEPYALKPDITLDDKKGFVHITGGNLRLDGDAWFSGSLDLGGPCRYKSDTLLYHRHGKDQFISMDKLKSLADGDLGEVSVEKLQIEGVRIIPAVGGAAAFEPVDLAEELIDLRKKVRSLRHDLAQVRAHLGI